MHFCTLHVYGLFTFPHLTFLTCCLLESYSCNHCPHLDIIKLPVVLSYSSDIMAGARMAVYPPPNLNFKLSQRFCQKIQNLWLEIVIHG